MKSPYILAIDQGTTSSRAIIYNGSLDVIASASEEVAVTCPHSGWVEQDAEALWQSVVNCIRQALHNAALKAEDIAGIGITNQRETTVLWHKDTSKALYPAIVWQDRRGADYCQRIIDNNQTSLLSSKTGLLADPYFSATKLQWLLDNVPGARQQAERGELCFGTIDCYLLWRLTGGKVHATDASNASRTLLFNIHSQNWDPELLNLFNIPQALLPEVMDTAAPYGYTDKTLFGETLPILAMIGDQQAALLGQACTQPGMGKYTYGTGCFAVVNTGTEALSSQHKLLSTVAWRLAGRTCYALEGSIFMAGATIQWLRDKLKIIATAAQSETLAKQISYQQTELLIPAFTGLGAPYWQPTVKAALFGLSRDSGAEHIAAAALRSVAFQSRDLLEAMQQDGINLSSIRVDGGMTANHWFLQTLADITQQQIQRSATTDATAFGAAFLVAFQLGIYTSVDDISPLAQLDWQFVPALDKHSALALYQRWQRVIQALQNINLDIAQ